MTPLDPASFDRVNAYWAQYLGCSPDTFSRQTAQVLVNAGLRDYTGCFLIEFGAAPVISLPPHEVAIYRDAVVGWGPGITQSPELVQGVFGERVLATVGPAFIGYTDREHFRPVFAEEVRPLTASDLTAFEALRCACTLTEWEHGGTEFRPGAMVGAFRGPRLAALASYELWGDHLAHLCIITHPGFRDRGHATAAVAALTNIVLDRRLVPQYRTLEANAASMAVARRLGFVPHATSLAVRLSLQGTENPPSGVA